MRSGGEEFGDTSSFKTVHHQPESRSKTCPSSSYDYAVILVVYYLILLGNLREILQPKLFILLPVLGLVCVVELFKLLTFPPPLMHLELRRVVYSLWIFLKTVNVLLKHFPILFIFN